MEMPLGLAGRERELGSLLEAWRRCRNGETLGLAIVGATGIGKTALIRRLRRQLRGESRFVVVRCLAGEMPYRPLLRALRQLLQQLLMAEEQALRSYRRKLRRAIGTGERRLTALLPELAVLLGEARSESRQYLPAGTAARSQLEAQLLRLLRALGDPPIPLVLGFDDLHLADPILLRWLALLLRSPRAPGLLLLLIGTEPGEKAWAELAGQLETLRLGPLGVDAVSGMLAATDGLTAEASVELAARLHQMSGGHPQALEELLQALVGADALRLTPGRAYWQGAVWRAALQRAALPPSQAVDRVALLPPDTRALLGVLSLLGDEAGSSWIAATAEVSEEQAERGLALAAAAGLVIRRVRPEGAAWRFALESARQAAASQLAESTARAAHSRAAAWLLRTCPERPAGERLTAILRHLNACVDDEGTSDARQLAAWNRQAGMYAIGRCDYGAALSYLRLAERLLHTAGTHAERYEASLARLAMEHIAGPPGEAARLAGQLRQEARDAGERARLFVVEMRQHAYAGRRSEAIDRGLELLAQLGVCLDGASVDGSPQDVSEIARLVVGVEEGRMAERAVAGAGMDGPDEEAWIVEVLMATAAAAGFADQRLLARLLAQAVRLSARSGRTSGSAIEAYAGYAGLLLWTAGDAERAAALAARAVELAARQDDLQVKANVYGAVYPLYARLMSPRERHRFVRQAARSASATGIAHADSVSASMRASSYYLAGNLRALRRYLHWQQARIARDGGEEDPYLVEVMGLYGAFLDGMQGEHAERCLPELPRASRELAEYQLLQGQYGAMQVQLCALLGRPRDALELAAASRVAVETTPMLPHEPEYWLYTGLAAAAAAERGTLELALGRLAIWSERAPANYGYKHRLLRGDLARLDGSDTLAVELYETAMQESRAQRNPLLSAIAAARAAELHSRVGRPMSAALLSAAAAADSQRAGAYAVAASIRESWREDWRLAGLLSASGSQSPSATDLWETRRRSSGATVAAAQVGARQADGDDRAPAAPVETTGRTDGQAAGGEADSESVRESAQQLADPLEDCQTARSDGHAGWLRQDAVRDADLAPADSRGWPIQLDELVQASGASCALLVVRHEAGLDTAARWDACEPRGKADRDEPDGLLRLAERMGEPVVLEDESALAPFWADPYLRQRAVSAAAVLPVTDLGRVIGYLYVERANGSLMLPPREAWEPRAAQAIRELAAERAASIGESRLAERLTPREREVLALAAQGLSNREAAARLTLAEGTVKIHLNRIYDKLGVKRRTQAIERARQLGLL